MRAPLPWELAAVLTVVAGCAGSDKVPKYVTNFDLVQPDMTKSEVRRLLGMPSLVSTCPGSLPPSAVQAPTDEWTAFKQEMKTVFTDGELWQYGSFGLSDFGDTPQLMDGSPKSFAVWFDNQGKVMRVRHPMEGPYAAEARPQRPPPGSPSDIWSGDPFGRDKAKAGPPTAP